MRAPSALVVGLLPAQAQRVRRALGDRYRLRFVTSEHARSLTQASDINILCIDWIDHTSEHHLKRKLKPGQTLHYVRGLDRQVINQLENHQCQPSF